MIRDLKLALPYIAGAMASTFGVRVLQGNAACTDAKQTIYLPPLPDDDHKTTVKALGFIGHEAAHIKDTDPDVANETESAAEMGMLNSLEDMRIDKRQMARFPGFADTRAEMMQNLVDAGELLIPDMDSPPFQIMERFVHYTLRCEFLGQQQLEPVRAATEEVFRAYFPRGVQVRLEAMMFEVANTKSTRDVLDLTRAILSMVEDEAKKEEEKEKQQQEQQQQQAQEEIQGGEQDGQGSNDDQGSQGSSSSSGDQGGNDVQDGQGHGEQQGQSSAEGQSSGIGQTDGADNSQPAASQKLRQVLAAGQADVPEEFGQMLARQLGVISQSTPAPQTTRVFNAEIQQSQGMDGQFDAESRASVNMITHAMHSMVEEQTLSSKRHTDIGMRIAPSKLHMAKINPKVFVRKARAIDPDAAVTLLLDRSGSTNTIIGNLSRIAYAVSSALSLIEGVDTAVGAFPMPDVQYLTYFGDIPQANSQNFSSLDSGGGTPMAEALNRLAIDLLMQDKQKHLMFVVTDGAPSNVEATRQAVMMAEGAGIEVYGVGINVNLSHLFRNWISISSMDELPTKLFGLVQGALLQNAA